MEDCINKITSLEEKALAQMAINLCQEDGFKEIALCLEKPTYGFLIEHGDYFITEAVYCFVDDPEILSEWSEVLERRSVVDSFIAEKVRRWDAAVEEQSRKLTEGIPHQLRQKIHRWMYHIALEYLSYSRRQEVLFGVSRYLLMNIFASGDWREAARLDERKIAQRLLEDERLSVLQRFRIACVYCLQAHIPQLWESLTQEEKQFTSKGRSVETHGLVLLWLQYMNADRGGEVEWREDNLWRKAAREALSYGNCTVLMSCWKEIRKDIQQDIVVDWALLSLRKWEGCTFDKDKILQTYFPTEQYAGLFEDFNIPSNYSELIHFFVMQMYQEQQLAFFKKAFQSECHLCVPECFLDWPYQNDFLTLMNRLWGIIPKNRYGQCLLALARRYSGSDKNSSRVYDYGHLLEMLWEETPEEYKQYVFNAKKYFPSHIPSELNDGEKLLSQLLERSPFQEKEEALFKHFFRDLPQERRREMMLYAEGQNSKHGEGMCLLLMQRDRWSFANWLLEECLPQEEIPCFKRQLIRSVDIVELCCDALIENRERLAENVIAWGLESNTERSQYKDDLVNKKYCLDQCEYLLLQGKFADVDCALNFCLSSEEEKERCKVRLAQSACDTLLEGYQCRILGGMSYLLIKHLQKRNVIPSEEKKERLKLWFTELSCGTSLEQYKLHSSLGECVWEQMDAVIAWSVNSEEKVRELKKYLLSSVRLDVHYGLVFIQSQWEEIERFYQWFSLSPEEVIKLKEDTLFSPRAIQCVRLAVSAPMEAPVDSLRWCLTDERQVTDLRMKVEEVYCEGVEEKQRLDHLVSQLLDTFRTEDVRDKESTVVRFVKGTREKRSSVPTGD